MSKKFYAVNRESGERWKPDKTKDGCHFLVMYDSGYLAEVEQDWETYITPLNPKYWETVIK